MKRLLDIGKKGLTLVELTIGLAVISIITASVAPFYIKQAHIKAADKTALEMAVIQEAARVYYVDNNSWPADIPALQSGGYLNSSWVTNNPWNNPYSVSSTANLLTVLSNVDAEWAETVASGLSGVNITGETVGSTIPIPGSSLGNTRLEYIGTSNVVASAYAPEWEVMPSMAVNFTASGQNRTIILFMASMSSSRSGGGIWNVALRIDGGIGDSRQVRTYGATDPTQVALMDIVDLTAGEHLIEVLYNNVAGSAIQQASVHGNRKLIIME